MFLLMTQSSSEGSITDTVAGTVQETIKPIQKLYEYLLDKAGDIGDFMVRAVFAILIFLICRRIINWICKLVQKNLRLFHADEGLITFVLSIVKYGLNALVIITMVIQLGIMSEATIAAAIASCGVAVSLALQGSLSNFAGGILIMVLRPFKVGDYIVLPSESREGTVQKIDMYYTTLCSYDNRLVRIPNSNLTNNTIINVSAMDTRKLDIKVGISYESSIPQAKAILERLVKEDDRLAEEGMQIFVDELGSSSVVLCVRAYVKTENYWPAKWDMNEKIKAAFDAEGISIPFEQLDVHIG